MSREVTLVFSNLYDDKWVAFPKKNKTSRFKLPIIIFPKGFQPEIGNKYKCRVIETAMGVFVYNGQQYKMAFAMSTEMGTEIDHFEYRLSLLEKRQSHLRKDDGLTMKNAFETLFNKDGGFKRFVEEKKAASNV